MTNDVAAAGIESRNRGLLTKCTSDGRCSQPRPVPIQRSLLISLLLGTGMFSQKDAIFDLSGYPIYHKATVVTQRSEQPGIGR